MFGKYKLRSSTIDKIGESAFTADFLTVANTLLAYSPFTSSTTLLVENQFVFYMSQSSKVLRPWLYLFWNKIRIIVTTILLLLSVLHRLVSGRYSCFLGVGCNQRPRVLKNYFPFLTYPSLFEGSWQFPII